MCFLFPRVSRIPITSVMQLTLPLVKRFKALTNAKKNFILNVACVLDTYLAVFYTLTLLFEYCANHYLNLP